MAEDKCQECNRVLGTGGPPGLLCLGCPKLARVGETKCPKCGAEIENEYIDSYVFECGTLKFKGDGSVSEGHQCLRNQLAALQAIVDKLPSYADTGESFVPGFDACWVIILAGSGEDEIYDVTEDDDLLSILFDSDGWLVNWGGSSYGGTRTFYSTRKAAEAGKGSE